MESIDKLRTFIRRNQRDIAVTLLWAAGISLILIKTHYIFYLENEAFSVYDIAYKHYMGPAFTDIDRVLLLAVSIVAGVLLIDMKNVALSYFSSMIGAFSIGTTYIYAYVWWVLGYGEFLQSAFDWEYAFLVAFANVFRLMVPTGIVFSLLGVIIGSLLRAFSSY